MMATNTARIHVGRLLELSLRAGYRTVADVDALFDQIDREVGKLPRTRQIVTCGDFRYCQVMAPETFSHLAKKVASYNPRTERSVALFLPDSPTAVLQFARLIREAQFADRKVFSSPQGVIDWLGEILTPEETARLREFLNT